MQIDDRRVSLSCDVTLGRYGFLQDMFHLSPLLNSVNNQSCHFITSYGTEEMESLNNSCECETFDLLCFLRVTHIPFPHVNFFADRLLILLYLMFSFSNCCSFFFYFLLIAQSHKCFKCS